MVQQFSMSGQLLHHLLEVAPAMMSLFKAEEERTEQWVWWCHPGHHFRGMDTSSCWGKTCGRGVATDAFAPSPLKMTWCPWRSCGRQRLCPVPRPGRATLQGQPLVGPRRQPHSGQLLLGLSRPPHLSQVHLPRGLLSKPARTASGSDPVPRNSI